MKIGKTVEELQNENIDLLYYLNQIYLICDGISTKDTKDINEIWELACLALDIEYDQEY